MKKKLIANLLLWGIVMALVFFIFYNRAITEYRKINPVTGEEYGQMGYYTDWGRFWLTALVITAVWWIGFGVIVWRRRKRLS